MKKMLKKAFILKSALTVIRQILDSDFCVFVCSLSVLRTELELLSVVPQIKTTLKIQYRQIESLREM